MLVFGHAGTRVLAFPTSRAHFYEWEDFGMVRGLADHLENGWIQLFCVDGVDSESWLAGWRHPAERAQRHVQYDRYVADEVLPFTSHKNANPFLMTTGASFGAYHAASFAFRYPHLVNRVIGLSGYYDVTRFTGGYSDDNVYFNNPCAFLASEHDPARLGALRRQDIILAVGREDAACANNEYLSGLLWRKDVGHALRIWNGWYHDWPYWVEMLRLYIGGHD